MPREPPVTRTFFPATLKRACGDVIVLELSAALLWAASCYAAVGCYTIEETTADIEINQIRRYRREDPFFAGERYFLREGSKPFICLLCSLLAS